MYLHSFIYQDETRPIARFRKITSQVSKIFKNKNPFELVAFSSKKIPRVRNGNVESRKYFQKIHVSGFKILKQTRCSKTAFHGGYGITTANPFVHTNSYLFHWNFNEKNFRLKFLRITTSRMRIVTQMLTGVTVTKISKSQNPFQCDAQTNADGLSRWWTENVSVKEKISNRCFIWTSRKDFFQTTASNQTLKPFLGVADQDPSFQIPKIPKIYNQWKDPINATAKYSKNPNSLRFLHTRELYR